MARRTTLLEQLIRARHWTHDQALEQMERTARDVGVRGYTLSRRQFARWLSREVVTPRGVSCQVAERLFGYPIERLLAPVEQPPRTSHEEHPVEEPLEQAHSAGDVGDAAAMSRDHAALVASGCVDQATLEQLQAEVRRLAHAYATSPPLLLHAALVRTRDLAYQVLARTRRPVQLVEAYLVAGQVCGLLATTAFDLGSTESADDQARAAYTYGQVIGHDRLSAWARSVQATISFWSGRPREGLRYARTAQEYAYGAQAARLHAIAARSWSMLGATGEADLHLRRAFAGMENDGRGDDLAEIGGEFAFGPARLALCAGAVHVGLGHGREAARRAHEALQLYQATPPDQQRFGVRYGAWIDLATARTLERQLEGAEAALQPAMQLDPSRRTARLTRRLLALRGLVTRADYRDAPAAKRIAEAASAFAAGSLASTVRALPPGS